MSITALYLLFVVIPNLGVYCRAAFTVCAIIACLVGIAAAIIFPDNEKAGPSVWTWAIRFGVAAAIVAFVGVFLPSDKQLYTIAGGYYATNNAELKKMPDNVFKAANSYLEKLQAHIEEKPVKPADKNDGH